MKAAKAFSRSARATMGFCPGPSHDGQPWFLSKAITVLGETVRYRTSACLHNRPEQDHRGIKVGPDGCFEEHDAASRFCREHGELRDLLRPRHRHNQIVSASLHCAYSAHSLLARLGHTRGGYEIFGELEIVEESSALRVSA